MSVYQEIVKKILQATIVGNETLATELSESLEIVLKYE